MNPKHDNQRKYAMQTMKDSMHKQTDLFNR